MGGAAFVGTLWQEGNERVKFRRVNGRIIGEYASVVDVSKPRPTVSEKVAILQSIFFSLSGLAAQIVFLRGYYLTRIREGFVLSDAVSLARQLSGLPGYRQCRCRYINPDFESALQRQGVPDDLQHLLAHRLKDVATLFRQEPFSSAVALLSARLERECVLNGREIARTVCSLVSRDDLACARQFLWSRGNATSASSEGRVWAAKSTTKCVDETGAAKAKIPHGQLNRPSVEG